MSVLEVDLTREQCEAIRWRDGYEDGREQGERNKAYETALRMKEDNVPVETIAKYTDLTEDEIEKL